MQYLFIQGNQPNIRKAQTGYHLRLKTTVYRSAGKLKNNMKTTFTPWDSYFYIKDATEILRITNKYIQYKNINNKIK